MCFEMWKVDINLAAPSFELSRGLLFLQYLGIS